MAMAGESNGELLQGMVITCWQGGQSNWKNLLQVISDGYNQVMVIKCYKSLVNEMVIAWAFDGSLMVRMMVR